MKFILPVIVIFLAAAGGVWLYRSAPSPKTIPTSQVNTCTSAPIESEIGSMDYPVSAKYSHLDRTIGSIFTAHDCSTQRFTEVTNGNNKYDLGVDMLIKSNASVELIDLLRSLGFKNTGTAQWKMENSITIINLLKLQPFYKEIIGTDCINCG